MLGLSGVNLIWGWLGNECSPWFGQSRAGYASVTLRYGGDWACPGGGGGLGLPTVADDDREVVGSSTGAWAAHGQHPRQILPAVAPYR